MVAFILYSLHLREMTSLFDYVEYIFPAALVHRLLSGVGRARRVVVSRAPDHYVHFAAATFSDPVQIVALLHYQHGTDANEAPRLWLPRRLWYCTTLHMSWIQTRHEPLIPRKCFLDGYQFEIVFDLDLPMFDDRKRQKMPIRDGFLCDCASTHRGCCSSCWLLVRMARRALAVLVPADWGPGLWVYSGNKGAHCVYGSETARSFPKGLRKIFSTSLVSMIKGRSEVPRRISDALLQAWVEFGVRELKVLARDNACHILADAFLVPNSPAHAKFLVALEKTPDSALRWGAFVRFGGDDVARKVVCELGLPRIDPVPLTQRRGRIKCPFSLHMTSRRLALPLPDAAFESFDPRDAPSLNMDADKLRASIQASCVYLEQWLNTNTYGV
jgi:hypothetical protein